jgi:hypothetical protein
MKSGRNKQSRTAFQQLVDDLTQHDSVTEVAENVFKFGREITLLVAFNSEEYYQRSGRYWFSLATTKYNRLLELDFIHLVDKKRRQDKLISTYQGEIKCLSCLQRL